MSFNWFYKYFLGKYKEGNNKFLRLHGDKVMVNSNSEPIIPERVCDPSRYEDDNDLMDMFTQSECPDYLNDFDIIDDDISRLIITEHNPATGLPMVGGIDICGNSSGMSDD